MWLVNLQRFLCGYIQFSAFGGFPERFINLCGRDEIPLWNISGGKREFNACTSIRGYKKIQPCARKSGMQIQENSRHGLPFWLENHKSRMGVLVGAAFSALIIFYLSTMIWTVEVDGSVNVRDEQILKAFDELGVHAGAKRSDLNIEKLQEEGLLKLPELSWLAVNVRNSAVVIEVRERAPAPDMVESGEPQNLVSSADGVIASIQALDGKAAVKRGDTVFKGELLVNGIVTNQDSSVTFKHSRGRVTAYTKRTLECFCPYKTELLCKSEEFSQGITLSFFNLKIPLGVSSLKCENSYANIIKHSLKTDSAELPVGFFVTKNYGCEKKNLTLTKNQALVLACADLAKKESEELFDKAVLNRRVTVEFNESGCVVRGEYDCEENIAAPQKLEIEGLP